MVGHIGFHAAIPRTQVIESRVDYLYVEFSTSLMGFVDDDEFYCDGRRSGCARPRLGYSISVIDRKRIESIRAAYRNP